MVKEGGLDADLITKSPVGVSCVPWAAPPPPGARVLTLEKRVKHPRRLTMQYTSGRRFPLPPGFLGEIQGNHECHQLREEKNLTIFECFEYFHIP